MPQHVLNGQKGPDIRNHNHIRISTYRFDYMADLYIPFKISENESVDREQLRPFIVS